MATFYRMALVISTPRVRIMHADKRKRLKLGESDAIQSRTSAPEREALALHIVWKGGLP